MPLARRSKSVSATVVSITLLSISIVLLSKLSAVTTPVLVMSTVVVAPLTVKSLFNTTLLFGTNIVPVPLARNSKSAFVVVVVI